MAILTICHCEDRSLTRLDAKFWKKMGVLPLLDRLDETGKILPDEPSGKLEEEECDLMVQTVGLGAGDCMRLCAVFFSKKNMKITGHYIIIPPKIDIIISPNKGTIFKARFSTTIFEGIC